MVGEQVDYYRALSPQYEMHSLREQAGGEELEAALERFAARGDVLELACGPGGWTVRLLAHAKSVTAVDASPEMLGRAAQRAEQANVRSCSLRFVHADLFSWQPDRRYDEVFFGFWLSHVPLERFQSFWALVANCLRPGGRVLFFDDGHRVREELDAGENSATVTRRLLDGSAHRAVKVPHEPERLQQRLRALGWDVKVTQTVGPFYWGEGTLAQVAA